MINIKDTLVLNDNNEYIIVSKTIYANKIYLYLVDINNNENFKFCYLENDQVVENNNKTLNTILLLQFYKEIKNNKKDT